MSSIATLTIPPGVDPNILCRETGCNGQPWGFANELGVTTMSVNVSYLAALSDALEDYDAIALKFAKEDKLESLAAERKKREQAWTFGGVPINLSETTQFRITAAVVGLRLKQAEDEDAVVNWEASRGVFVTLNLPTLEAMGKSAFDHVQACFLNVKAKTVLIQAATSVTDLNQIDLEDDWPS